MRKLWVGGCSLAVMLVVLNGLHVGAADKKDTKKTDATSAAGVIEIKEGKDSKFRYFVRDGDGKLLAMSGPTGFATAEDAEKSIAELRTVVVKAKVVTVKGDDKK